MASPPRCWKRPCSASASGSRAVVSERTRGRGEASRAPAQDLARVSRPRTGRGSHAASRDLVASETALEVREPGLLRSEGQILEREGCPHERRTRGPSGGSGRPWKLWLGTGPCLLARDQAAGGGT